MNGPSRIGRIRRWLTYQRLVPLLALASGAPATAVSLVLVWTGDFAERTQWSITVFVLGAWLFLLFHLRERLVRPLHAVSNMLEALREGDYSLRTRTPNRDDALGLILHEVNQLAQSFHDQRLDALEASNLLSRIMAVIDVALFAFDENDELRLLNPAGERLLGQQSGALIGRDATDLGLVDCLEGPTPRVMDLTVSEGLGRWELRRRTFRWDGRPHRLVVLTDLSQVLREEERVAWQRLIRVLGHEINNSLTPIKSITESLASLLERDEPLDLYEEDLRDGLAVIGGRSEALGRFMASYARLAKLPAPERRPLEVGGWVRRVASLETRLPVQVVEGDPIEIEADSDQLDQLLINLVENAADASLETGGGVRVGWERSDGEVVVWVEDEGQGLAATANLFVAFFTTKPTGSGIGLALGRQIAEAHGGTLTLRNRRSQSGCVARVKLPIDARATEAPGLQTARPNPASSDPKEG
jgi:nitrogen fixation/metabolism regulation signal transduction histidine kinase